MTIINNYGTSSDLDMALIPQVIYEDTINKNKEKIESYFILHPYLMFSFVGYNGALKLSNELGSNKKCGCFYNMPWLTHWANENNVKKTTLSYSQQIEEYRYMILYWYPSPKISYMQWLSQIALGMILDIKQYNYYLSNNLQTCTIFQKNYYKDNFKSEREFYFYIKNYLANSKLKIFS
jgi:hypothetical protein